MLIRDLFSPVDAQHILQIPLNVQVIEDFIAWKYTRSGAFSVCSAYRREWEHHHGKRMCTTDGQGSVDENPIWKEI